MLAGHKRLKRGEIEYLMRKGEQSTSTLFLLRHSENQENFSKYCVIISRKIDNKAVARNRVRRRIQEAIRTIDKDLSAKKHLNILIVPKKQITAKDFSEIKADLSSILTKLHHG